MDPQVVKVLHDAFRKALDDAKVQQMLDRFDQPTTHIGPAEYTAWAKKTLEAERGTIDRLRPRRSM